MAWYWWLLICLGVFFLGYVWGNKKCGASLKKRLGRGLYTLGAAANPGAVFALEEYYAAKRREGPHWCPACGAKIGYKQPVCPECRAGLTWGKKSDGDQKQHVCQYCGAELPCKGERCPSCGAK